MNDELPFPLDELPLPPLLGDVTAAGFEEFHRRLADEGYAAIRQGHGCVFRFIDANGTRLTALADRSGVTKQAVGEVVDDLERLGYVERVPDAVDRRAKTIRLTQLGADAQRVALRIFGEIERGWEERYGAERVAIMREVLTEIAAAERVAAPA